MARAATNTVAAPNPINTTVATSERTERRPNPHTPCPLVQPEPSTVPKPTNSPAKMSKGSGRVATAGVCSSAAAAAPANTKPAMKAQRQARSSTGAFLAGANAPDAMPLIPATRPRDARSSQLAKPIKTPPIAACANGCAHHALAFMPKPFKNGCQRSWGAVYSMGYIKHTVKYRISTCPS
jgi:hypothetical protein